MSSESERSSSSASSFSIVTDIDSKTTPLISPSPKPFAEDPNETIRKLTLKCALLDLQNGSLANQSMPNDPESLGQFIGEWKLFHCIKAEEYLPLRGASEIDDVLFLRANLIIQRENNILTRTERVNHLKFNESHVKLNEVIFTEAGASVTFICNSAIETVRIDNDGVEVYREKMAVKDQVLEFTIHAYGVTCIRKFEQLHFNCNIEPKSSTQFEIKKLHNDVEAQKNETKKVRRQLLAQEELSYSHWIEHNHSKDKAASQSMKEVMNRFADFLDLSPPLGNLYHHVITPFIGVWLVSDVEEMRDHMYIKITESQLMRRTFGADWEVYTFGETTARNMYSYEKADVEGDKLVVSSGSLETRKEVYRYTYWMENGKLFASLNTAGVKRMKYDRM